MAAAVETVRFTEVGAWSRQFEAELTRLDWRPFFKVARLLIVADTKQHFVQATAPDGTPWLPLKRTSKRRGGSRAKPLRDTGLLMMSVTANGQGHVEEITARQLVFGSNLDRAGWHNFGTRTIPARPFLGFSPKLVAQIDRAAADYAAKALARGQGGSP